MIVTNGLGSNLITRGFGGIFKIFHKVIHSVRTFYLSIIRRIDL